MKIGILTLPPYINIGGILQAYALQSILEHEGHVVSIITPEYSLTIRIKKYIKSLLGIILKKETLSIDSYTKSFINKNLHIKRYKSLKKIKNNEFDAIIVGSDQIWRPSFFKYQFNTKETEDVFLNFTTGWSIRRLAYAVSFGVDEWEYDKTTTEKCRNLIKAFDAVSVRELSGKRLCERYLRYDKAELVLDPTFLLDKNDYLKLFDEGKNVSHPYIVSYILDMTPQKQSAINEIASSRKISVQVVNATNCSLQPSVECWLRSIYEAQIVITDSFHACVFSIIFNKPFIVLENKKRGLTRIQSLLNTFNISDRFVKENMSISKELLDMLPNVDYSMLKKKSLDFLMKNI